jgi:DNA-binding CsgD family transcriptional regulator
MASQNNGSSNIYDMKKTEEPIKNILASSKSVKELFKQQILNKSKLGVV